VKNVIGLLIVALLHFVPGVFIASAHPGSGIVVDDKGQVYFQDVATRAVWKIDPRGRLTEYHTGIGGH
jgi:streptogramin lyase